VNNRRERGGNTTWFQREATIRPNEELIPSSINQYMVGFAHSLHIQSDLNPKIKLCPLDDMCTVYVRLRFLLTFAKLAPRAGFSTLKKIKFWSFPDYEIKYIHRFKLIYRVFTSY